MTCFECERGELLPSAVCLNGERHGESFSVRVQGSLCNHCGFETVDSEQSAEFTKAISDAYRAAHGLLTGQEIRARRKRLGMTQQQFSEYLGAGIASVKRWECGQIQERAMDELIRLKTDQNAALENLRNLQSRSEPEPLILFDGDDISLSIEMPKMLYFERAKMVMGQVTVLDDEDEELISTAPIAA